MTPAQPDPQADPRTDPQPDRWSAEFWDSRYSAHGRVWSGQPNRWLVSDAASLTPGHALDVGCGEGADAIWLAERGWTVTAVDVSPVALERGREAAAAAGVADRITFAVADLRDSGPPDGPYDLVSVHFLHFPSALRTAVNARLAAAVAPGGTLLLVGHHPSDMDGPMPRPQEPDLFATEQDLAADLAAGADPREWEIEAAEARPHPAGHPDGYEVTVHDAVLRARRL